MTVEVYENAGDEYRWHLESANGRLMADSGEGTPTAAAQRTRSSASKRTRPRRPCWTWVAPPSNCSRTARATPAGGSATATGTSWPTPGRGYADRTRAREGIEA